MTNFTSSDTFQVHMIVTRENSDNYQAYILNDAYLPFHDASTLLNNMADRYDNPENSNRLTRRFYLVDQTGYSEFIRSV